jgi:hypothetical protein
MRLQWGHSYATKPGSRPKGGTSAIGTMAVSHSRQLCTCLAFQFDTAFAHLQGQLSY